jgi:exosome complex RNA-binding protein Csl4
VFRNQGSFRRWTAVLTLALALAMTLAWVTPGFAEAKGWGNLKNAAKFMEKAQRSLEKHSNLRFNDLDDCLWAIGAIAKMRGLGIINGYDGNVFRPNSAVKQAEALAMIVRALDMEEEAEALAQKFGGTYAGFGYQYDDEELLRYFNVEGYSGKDVEKMLKEMAKQLERRMKQVNGTYLPFVPSNTQWALGYILLAVDEGWVKISEINPNAAASRAWISMVMVRALGEEEAAQDAMDEDLPYKDANAIPDSMVGYVAVAVELGLFEGYPDGQFKPNRAVTRAEMATIIDRFLSEELPDETSYSMKGKITSVTRSKITVKADTGRSATYNISPDALVVIDKRPASVSELEVGDRVEVLSNGKGVALLITVLEEEEPTPITSTVTGEITAKASSTSFRVKTADGEIVKVTLGSGCKITYGKETLKFSDLRVGDKVRATIVDGKATAVRVTSRGVVSELVEGIITHVDLDSSGCAVVIDTVYDAVVLELDDDVEITYRSRTLDIEDLRVGDKVEATVLDDVVVEIVITARNQTAFGDVGGTIVSISQSASEYIITVDDGDEIASFTVPTDCVITYNNTHLSRTGLRLGDVIRAELNNDDEAVEIRIYDRAS